MDPIDFQHKQARLSIQDALGIRDIHWYHVPPLFPIATNIMNYVSSHLLSLKTIPERIQEFINLYYRCCNVCIGNEAFFPKNEVIPSIFSDLDIYGQFTHDGNGIYYICPLSALYQKVPGGRVTWFVNDISRFFETYRVDETNVTESITYNNNEYRLGDNNKWYNDRDTDLVSVILEELDFSGFGLIFFTYVFKFMFGNTEINFTIKVIPDELFNIKYLLKRLLKWMRFSPTNEFKITDFSTIQIKVKNQSKLQEDFTQFFKAFYYFDFGRTVKSIEATDHLYVWRQLDWREPSGSVLMDWFKYEDQFIRINDDWEIKLEFLYGEDESTDEETETDKKDLIELYVDQLMYQMGVLQLGVDRYTFIFTLTNLLTAIWFQLHIQYPGYFIDKEVKYDQEDEQSYYILEPFVNDRLWVSLR